ncbi:oxidoreductase of aldo/keto reductase family, subgroup 1 [Lentilactobacillus kosonis]|uniref:Oxidoreductase of aldo/keto reductase family, subgroup 1 n=1 Tax=Lentilactobacillus kosonis TaxID=2810561 RepID=A0A401FJ01_9LACO|nr:oxidoreductase of aldo/keto reductase family, subgroup 1 [Lentilactobacillus kosonis]
MINSLSDTVELNNGTKIPGLGLGVFQISEKDTPSVVKNAIVNGYRLIDTAAIYGNEIGTGKGIKGGLKAANLSREDLFITSKYGITTSLTTKQSLNSMPVLTGLI